MSNPKSSKPQLCGNCGYDNSGQGHPTHCLDCRFPLQPAAAPPAKTQQFRIPEQELADLEARAESAEQRCERLLAACRKMDLAYQRVPDTHLPLDTLVSSGRWNEMCNAIDAIRAAIEAAEQEAK